MFRYDKRTGRIEDDETGIVLRHGGKTDVDMAAYIFFDPSNLEGLSSSRYLKPGEVQLFAEFIYAGPPAKTNAGGLNWQPFIGFNIDTHPLRVFYASQLKMDWRSDEVGRRVEFACRKITDAITAEWRTDPKNLPPLIDFDNARTEMITIARNEQCRVLKA